MASSRRWTALCSSLGSPMRGRCRSRPASTCCPPAFAPPVGVKVIGRDLPEMEKVARDVEKAIKTVAGTSSAYAERVVGGDYIEIVPDRDRLARYGLMVLDVQDVIGTALGAEPITTTVEGRERYTVAIRYPRDLRSDPQSDRKSVV